MNTLVSGREAFAAAVGMGYTLIVFFVIALIWRRCGYVIVHRSRLTTKYYIVDDQDDAPKQTRLYLTRKGN